jgi:single-stranded DNA-binding protein
MPNRATLKIQGHAGQDPETKTTKGGKDYVSFSVGVSNGHKDQYTKEWVSGPTDWYRVFCFQNKQSILEKVKKGAGVSIVGSPKYSAYISKKTNEPVADLAIFANEVSLICYDRKESSGSYGDAAFEDSIEAGFMSLSDDDGAQDLDIPF